MSHNLIIGLELSPWTEIEELLTHDWKEMKITKKRIDGKKMKECVLSPPYNILFTGNSQTKKIKS